VAAAGDDQTIPGNRQERWLATRCQAAFAA